VNDSIIRSRKNKEEGEKKKEHHLHQRKVCRSGRYGTPLGGIPSVPKGCLHSSERKGGV
jgi:hypothetical protein